MNFASQNLPNLLLSFFSKGPTMLSLKHSLIAASLFAMSAGMAVAANKGTNSGKQGDGAASRKGEAATLAVQLGRYADKNKDATAMIVAARLAQDAGIRDTKLDKKSPEGTKAGPDYTPKAMLDRAKQYAGDRKDVIAMADDAAQASSRGRVEGPFRGTTVVKAGQTDVINVTLQGGDAALIAISGDGDSDLDLFVLDENGNQVCRSTSTGDDEYCRFTPKWTGKFTVRIKNHGRIDNRYQLMFN
jgi:hypothetical protein